MSLKHAQNMALCIAGPSRQRVAQAAVPAASPRRVFSTPRRRHSSTMAAPATASVPGDKLSAATATASHAPISDAASPSPRLASSIYLDSSSPRAASSEAPTPDLSPSHRATLSSLLRVDHSGEIAANTIYKAQSAVFEHIKRDPSSTALTLEMWENEKKHLKIAEILLKQHRVRPSLLNPVWGALGSLLGGATALMGREAAMACTEAVETVIGEHYDDQITHLDSVLASFRNGVAEGESNTAATTSSDTAAPPPPPVEQTLQSLRSLLEEFRDDELEHLDTAVEHDAQQAPGHALLSAVIGWGCKGAIEVAKRI